jgi:hypothetical protein
VIRVLGIIFVVALYIWFVVDVIQAPKSGVRNLPRAIWLLIVVLLPILGGLLWILFGRVKPAPGKRRGRRGPVAPDDDPRFLAKLDEDEWRRKMRERRGDAT